MSVDLQQVLRLEVERDPDPGELINLVPNPSGELGAWGWVTPVAGAGLVSFRWGRWHLIYTSPGAAPSHFCTVPVPVAEGQYAAGRITVTGLSGSTLFKVRIEWLDADGDLLSSTVQSAAYGGSPDPRAYGSFVAPAGAFWCRLRIDHYSSSSGNPAADTTLTFRDAVLTVADTAGQITWSRSNLLPTPTGDGGTGGWGSGNGTVSATSTVQLDGRDSLLLTKTVGDGVTAALSSVAISVTGGRDYAVQFRARAFSTRRNVTLAVRWFKDDGTPIRTADVATAFEPEAGSWSPVIGGVATAPTNAASMRLRAEYPKLADGEVHYINAVMVEPINAVLPWFDGDSTDTGTVTYSWNGTPHASSSVAAGAAGDPGELVPVTYQNILGPSRQISIDREALNVGSMSVRLFDAILDPTQSDLLRTGRRVRLVALHPDDGEQVVFAGKIFTGSVTYHLLHTDEDKRAEVILTAVDPVNPLASTPQREGVATIDELPHVLEPAGVPWNVNGSGNQVADAAVVAYNDNASVLDQVAVTRDTALGYAWVDRNGVLQAWDRAEIPTDVAAELDEDDYTADLNIDFDLESLINSVTVKVLRVIATTGATEEVTFGPYVDTDSYRQHGERAKEYVVQGIDVTDTAAIQDYADAILAANAQPQLRVNSVVLPIAGPNTEEVPFDRALLDLYDRVTVSNDRAGLTDDSRITRIQHDISASPRGGRWLMTLGFTGYGSVAPSTAVPSPPPSVGDVVDDVRGGYDGTLGELDTALEELNEVTLPQVQADIAAATAQIAGLNGLFPITATSISDGAISTPKLAANAVTGDKILGNTITGAKIVGLTITGDKIAANSISADKIVANSIGADRLAANAIEGKSYRSIDPAFGNRGFWINTYDFQAYDSAGGVTIVMAANSGFIGTPGNMSALGIVYGGDVYVTSTPAASGTGLGPVYMGAEGRLRLTTSAAKYKTNVEPLDFDHDLFLEIRGVTYDPLDTAEDDDEPANQVGMVADEFDARGLRHPVVYRDGEVESLVYDRVIPYHQEILRSQQALIAELTARIDALENAQQ